MPKRKITTVEEALERAGLELGTAQTSQLARQALAQGRALEIVTIVKPEKQGAVLHQEGRFCETTKYPTYIRLS